MSAKQVKSMSFEEAMAELEDVVGQLESGEVALEDSIKLYERGAALKAHCEARLKAAEEKVLAITQSESGEASGTRPLADAPAGRSAAPASPAPAAGGANDDEIPF